MARSTVTPPPDAGFLKTEVRILTRQKAPVATIAVLARWQFRQTWRVLLAVGAGVLLAVVLVCALPLYTQVSLSASLRRSLQADPQQAYLAVQASSQLFSTSAVQSVQQQVSQEVTSALGTLVRPTPDFSVQMGGFQLTPTSQVQLIGADMTRVGSQVKVLSGRLPLSSSGQVIEFAATQQAAQGMHLQLNQQLRLSYTIINQRRPSTHVLVVLQLVGIIAQTSPAQVFWHGQTFATDTSIVGLGEVNVYPLLVSNTELMAQLDMATEQLGLNYGSQFDPSAQPSLYWYYAFDFSRLDITDLSAVTSSLTSLLTTLSTNPAPPYVVNMLSPDSAILTTLQAFAERVTVLQVPVLSLTFLVTALALFFVLLLTDVLIERHGDAIIVMRSRGASSSQVLSSLLAQWLILALLAFVGGPLLAFLLVMSLITLTLAGQDVSAFNVLTVNLWQTVASLLERDALVVGVALATLVFAILRFTRSNVLAQRRESSRATQRPFWLRYRLDVLAALLSLFGFGLSLYIISPGVLDERTRTLILPLTTLLGVFFLLFAGLLLFLRILPDWLRAGERLAARNRGIAPLLALSQIARSPRQTLQVTLMLALAVAFTLFTVVFNATQTQRLQSLALYQVGSDFSGSLPSVLQANNWQSLYDTYRAIRGVSAVTLFASEQLSGGSDDEAGIQLEAVDSDTYAQTIYWNASYSTQSISVLMNQLAAQRAQAEQKQIIPAILDQNAASSLHVQVGQQFALADFHGPMTYRVLAIIRSIPTIIDEAGSAGTTTSIAQGGVLVDYQTYSTVALAVAENGVTPTGVFVRSENSPAAVQSVRQGLLTGTYALDNGLDLRSQEQALASDPSYKVLIGIIMIGAAVALFLAIFGNLLVSWLNARRRRVSFSVLRALGCQPRQVASVLLWEQGLITVVGLALGLLLSMLFSILIVPAFTFSPLLGSYSAAAFYLIQNTPPVQIVLPFLPLLGALLALLLVCLCAFFLMIRVLNRSQASQLLRLNED